jgi:hypothetical protein
MSDIIHLDHFRGSARITTRPALVKRAEPDHHPVLAARPERKRRKALWRKAEFLYRFYDGLTDIAFVAAHAYKDYGCQEAKPISHYEDMEHWHALVDKRRSAAKQLMLTPAPTMADLNLKRRMRSQAHHGIVEAACAEIDALIKADEAWLLANAGHRTQRRK